MNGPLATSLPAARYGHCLVKFEDKIFSTGGADENKRTTSNVWQFDSGDNFAKADGPEMKNIGVRHGCGIVHSIHHGSRPLLVVAGSDYGTEPEKVNTGTSLYLDPHGNSAVSHAHFLLYIIILKTIFKFLDYEICIVLHSIKSICSILIIFIIFFCSDIH